MTEEPLEPDETVSYWDRMRLGASIAIIILLIGLTFGNPIYQLALVLF